MTNARALADRMIASLLAYEARTTRTCEAWWGAIVAYQGLDVDELSAPRPPAPTGPGLAPRERRHLVP